MTEIYGIDVSTHNGNLDWEKIKASGIAFAIIRAGYGRTGVDAQFHNNIEGALSQNIPVGVYWFSYALNAAGAAAEAKKCLEVIAGYDIQLPVFFDFEYDTVRYAEKNGVTLGKEAYNDHAEAFLQEIEKAGYRAGIYYNLDYKRRFVDSNRLGKYTQWFAQYNPTPSWDGYDIWQKTSSHKIADIPGNFDLNIAKETFLQNKPKEKTVEQLAQEVLAGKHGSGSARKQSLGDKYEAVQAQVNALLGVKPAEKSVSTLAKEVIAGKHGSGDARRKSLGDMYEAVQAEVNRLLK